MYAASEAESRPSIDCNGDTDNNITNTEQLNMRHKLLTSTNQKVKMTIKTAKKFMKMSALLGFVALGSLSFNAAAAVITFGTGTAGFGGVVSFSPNPGDGDFVGTNINIGALTIAGSTSDGPYAVTNGVLSFSTATGNLDIQGSVADLSISNQTLLTGTIDNFFASDQGELNFFQANGSSTLSTDLLSAIGLSGTGFEYLAYNIESNELGQVINTGVVNTTSVVPVPAAAWLFGSAILGLLGIARRKRA